MSLKGGTAYHACRAPSGSVGKSQFSFLLLLRKDIQPVQSVEEIKGIGIIGIRRLPEEGEGSLLVWYNVVIVE